MAKAPCTLPPFVRIEYDHEPDGCVKLKIMIPGLAPTNDKYHPKGGTISLDFFNDGFKMEMKAELKGKNKEITKWEFKVKKFPSQIDISKSGWEAEKGKIVVKLVKKVDIPWRPIVDSQGLDQESSSDKTKASNWLENGD